MNDDQLKGKTKEVLGKAQKNVGRALGSRTDEREGRAKEVEGKVQKNFGNVKRDIADLIDD